LCDSVPLFRLGVGKYIKMTLKKKKHAPKTSDIYRCVIYGFPQPSPAPTKNSREKLKQG